MPERFGVYYARNKYKASETEKMSLIGAEYAEYNETDIDWEEYCNAREKIVAEDTESEYRTKLLGYADIIQNDMLSECELLR